MTETQKELHARQGDDIELRVASGSPAPKVAGAIVKYMEEGYEVALLAMGAGAVNQAVKAVCIARSMVSASGIDLMVIPGFRDEHIEGESKSAIRLSLRKR